MSKSPKRLRIYEDLIVHWPTPYYMTAAVLHNTQTNDIKAFMRKLIAEAEGDTNSAKETLTLLKQRVEEL